MALRSRPSGTEREDFLLKAHESDRGTAECTGGRKISGEALWRKRCSPLWRSGVSRAKVVVLGAGVVGTSAIKVAAGMGADVTVLDINLDRLEYLEDIYQGKVNTVYSTPQNIKECLKEADLVIGAVLIPGSSYP